jgi:hypothetical protein
MIETKKTLGDNELHDILSRGAIEAPLSVSSASAI